MSEQERDFGQERDAFRRRVMQLGQPEDVAAELAQALNVTRFLDDKGNVDGAKLESFAHRFQVGEPRRRNYGAGRVADIRDELPLGLANSRPRGPQAEIERRFGKRDQGQAQPPPPRNAGEAEARRRYGPR